MDRPDDTSAQKHIRRRLKTVLLALLGACLLFALAAAWSLTWNNDIATASYTVSSDRITGEGFRIVLISDLHRKKFDETNELVVTRTREQAPDLICVDGDMLEIDYTQAELEALRSLFERLTEIAPVYFSVGNHDAHAFFRDITVRDSEYVGFDDPRNCVKVLESTGAKLLEGAFEDITVNGSRVRIGGLYACAFRLDGEEDESWLPRKSFLEELTDTEGFRLLLAHRPESFYRENAFNDWDIELVLSGHTHNGVIALPFGLGAIWTNEGFFPKHDRGIFREGRITMVIGAGLDGHNRIPRVFNPPEIVAVDVVPAA